jgi:hypothetical protein
VVQVLLDTLRVSKNNLDRASRRLLEVVQGDKAAMDMVGKYVSHQHCWELLVVVSGPWPGV